ncbi:hypothetical protein G8G17_003483 [Vibrio cholerae]|nr:hypothetical protein [Vibrio cholerae]
MFSENNKKSIAKAIESFKSVFAMGGVLAATIAVVNFISAFVSFDFAYMFQVILDMYKAFVHQPMDWFFSLLDITVPSSVKDVIFFYLLLGGCFMRARKGEQIYNNDSNATIKTAFEALVHRKSIGGGVSMSTGLSAMYQNSPRYLQQLMDFGLWPRVAVQYYRSPMVHKNLYLGTFPAFAAGHKVGEMKPFQYDRRVVFMTQLLFISFGVVCVFIVNGFLTMAK